MSEQLDQLVRDATRCLFFRDFEQALGVLGRALQAARRAGAEDAETAILRAVGDARCGLLDFEGAEATYRAVLERLGGETAPARDDVAGLLTNLGYTLDKQQRFDEAEAVHQRALVIHTKLHGREDPHVIPCLNNLAYGYMQRGEVERAESLLERALRIAEASYGSEHVGVAEPLNNLGELLRRTGRAEQAALRLERALALMEANVPFEDHPDLLTFLRNTAAALAQAGQAERAEELMKRAERIQPA